MGKEMHSRGKNHELETGRDFLEVEVGTEISHLMDYVGHLKHLAWQLEYSCTWSKRRLVCVLNTKCQL